MCDLDTYRARIGLFGGKIPAPPSAGSRVTKVSEVDVCMSTTDVFLVFMMCWLSAFVCLALIINIEQFITPEMTILPGKNNMSGTMVYENTWSEDSCNNTNLPLTHLALHVPSVIPIVYVVHKTLSMWRLRLSGDVEENPGPDTAAKQPENGRSENGNENRTNNNDELMSKINDIIQQHIQNHTDMIRGDLSGIRKELSDIKQQCAEINGRCDRLEQEQKDLSDSVAVMSADINSVFQEVTESKEETDKLKNDVREFRDEIQQLNAEVDRLEGFSRRDNLRFFGIPQYSANESPDACVTTLVDILNNTGDTQTWSEEDFVRAHRVGQSKDGQPRPVIARLTRWKDKMHILTNKNTRDRLKQIGVSVANDLTRRQAAIVAQARREGKRAFFRNGVMVVGPAIQDSRTFAQVAAASGSDKGGVAPTQQRNAGGMSPHRQHGTGQGRGSQHGNSSSPVNTRRPCDEANHTSGGGVCSRETHASADPTLDSSSEGRQRSSLCDAGPSVTGQSSQGEGRREAGSPRRDVTGRHTGLLANQPSRGGTTGGGVPDRSDVTGQPGGLSGGRRNSTGRQLGLRTDGQTGLRSHHSNQTGGGRSDRSLRNKKAK